MLDLARGWSAEFAGRAGQHAGVRVAPVEDMPEAHRAALGRSLATFHIGETGTGEHVLTAARNADVDDDYLDALRRFLDEEHEHARLLAVVLEAIDQPVYATHWTDRAFVFIRRLRSLPTQVLTLLVAELVAVPYYGALGKGITRTDVASVFALIHADEVSHLDFHAETLPPQLGHLRRPARWALRVVWNALVTTTSVIVAFDHRRALHLVGTRARDFVADVWHLRRDVDARLFGASSATGAGC